MTVAKSLKTKPPKVGDVLYAADFSGQKWRVVAIAEKQMTVELSEIAKATQTDALADGS